MFLIKGRKGIFYLRFKQANGKWSTKSTKTRNKKLADKFKDNFIQSKNLPRRQNTTLGELVNKYVELKCNGDKNKAEEMKHRCCRLLIEHFGKDRIVDSLTSLDFENYKKLRLNRHKYFDKSKTISPVTVNIELRAYKALLNKGIRWKLIKRDPCN